MGTTPSIDIATVLQAHWPMLARMAGSYAADRAHRDDLLQEISIALWQALPRWRGEEGTLRAFIARVAHNRAMDALAGERRHHSSALHEHLPDPDADPVHHTANAQRHDGLLQAVRQLPLGLRQVVMLGLEGFTQREIGQALALEENTVAQRLSRARRQLRERMGGTR
ncbi:sigma-70 family RNA polymerase sigma factor [Stenotrophomonas indicatrix]|uniref:RNA polymerase sigma factor n=1 Tax=Stenotrophomonas TaxID=40323 RepID=UPI001F081D48|nr:MULTISPECIES: sigma-70 family RNA polymerase sigma factor [Stenotrophomonas]MDN8644890.1 sigma-70 family RNA polymerase sigma factor [Stenotrophomonas indicatrix]MDN8655507.1 sigma-70 family RNA polymerase sigma factor [Stenotrophomonas indicatrix]MDT9583343.1 sigma-70 family RNA polymerase sigma factor [Stenotrophomonas indicatrix]